MLWAVFRSGIAQSISHAQYRKVVLHASHGMSSSNAGSCASKSGSVGKPNDPVWQWFDKVDETNSAGELFAVGTTNRLHRKRQGCKKELKI